MDPARNQDEKLDQLRRRIARIEASGRAADTATVSTGCRELDGLLPGGGLRRGSLCEWLATAEGSGATSLALLCAAAACRDGGSLVVLDAAGTFHPPAALRWGIARDRLILVQAVGQADATWALDQALRCRGVSAALAWPEQHGDRPIDALTFRRLQLAAEQGGSLGLLVRPEWVRHDPSWAEVRWLIQALPSRPPAASRRRWLHVHLLRCRGGVEGKSMVVEFDDETHTLSVAAELADPEHPASAS